MSVELTLERTSPGIFFIRTMEPGSFTSRIGVKKDAGSGIIFLPLVISWLVRWPRIGKRETEKTEKKTLEGGG